MSNREWEAQYCQLPCHTPDDPRLIGASPCPFCGGRRLELSRTVNYIHCLTCGADGPESPYSRDVERQWRITLNRWNVMRVYR